MEDLDGDGKSDILWRNVGLNPPFKGQVAVWLTQLTDSGQLDYSFRQAVTFKNSDFMTAGIDQVKTVGRSIAIPAAATIVQVNLVNDTGTIGDRVTNSPDFKISVGDSNAIAELLISLDGQNWQSIKSQLVNNAVTIDRVKLESILGRSLEDGSYTVSVRSKDNVGKITNQSLLFDLDTLAPTLNVTGFRDGMTWDSTDRFTGSLSDRDALTRLEYWVNDGTKTSVALNATAPINGRSTLNFNNTALSNLDTLPKMVAQKLHVKGLDRAGNAVQYDYSFMRLDLPSQLEDSYLLGDDPIANRGGSDSRSTNGSSGSVPSGSGGSYYIGAGGGWGYSSGSGSGNWTPASSGWSPSNPGSTPNPGEPNPDRQLNYLQALDVILSTSIDVLSKHQAVVSKKNSLIRAKENLMGLGKIIQEWNLHDRYLTEFKNGFNGLFSLGYDSIDGQISWKDAVKAGWSFAKAIALDTKPVLLKAFESQTWGMFRGMMVKNNMTISVEQADTLKESIDRFSWNYVRLRPGMESDVSGSGSYNIALSKSSFADLIWNTKWSVKDAGFSGPIVPISDQQTENGWMGNYVYNYLQKIMDGMNAQKLIQGFDYAQVMMDAAARTVPFYNYTDTPARDAGPLRELIEIGFEMSRVGATNPAGTAAEPSAWLEAVMEGNAKLAGEGLSQFVAPFDEPSNGWFDGNRYGDICRSAFDYAQRLMRAAAGVQDAGLRVQVLRSDTLSELVNLGGAYAALNPNLSTIQSNREDPEDFLDTVWREKNIQAATSEMQNFLNNFNQPNLPLEVFSLQRKVLQVLKKVPVIEEQLRDINLNAAISVLSGHYAATFHPIAKDLNQSDFFTNIWCSKNQQDLQAVAIAFKKIVGDTPVSVQNIIDLISNRFMSAAIEISDENLTRAGGRRYIAEREKDKKQIFFDQALGKWLDLKETWRNPQTDFQFSTNVVNTKKALIITPYANKRGALSLLTGSEEEADIAEKRLKEANFQVDRIQDFSIQNLLDRDLGSYGVIFFSSHGSLYSYRDFQDMESSNSKTLDSILWANETVTIDSILKYRNQVLNLTLVVGQTGSGSSDFCISPSFIRKYSTNQNSNSIIYLGTCYSMANNSLADAFNSIGAGAVFGYTGVVGDDWAAQHGKGLFNVLSTGRTVAQVPFVGNYEYAATGTRFARKVYGTNIDNLALIGKSS